jgi:hypothetical protein
MAGRRLDVLTLTGAEKLELTWPHGRRRRRHWPKAPGLF